MPGWEGGSANPLFYSQDDQGPVIESDYARPGLEPRFSSRLSGSCSSLKEGTRLNRAPLPQTPTHACQPEATVLSEARGEKGSRKSA